MLATAPSPNPTPTKQMSQTKSFQAARGLAVMSTYSLSKSSKYADLVPRSVASLFAAAKSLEDLNSSRKNPSAGRTAESPNITASKIRIWLSVTFCTLPPVAS